MGSWENLLNRERTLEEFVEDLISDGRTPKEIRAIARSSRWSGQADEAKNLAERMVGKKS